VISGSGDYMRSLDGLEALSLVQVSPTAGDSLQGAAAALQLAMGLHAAAAGQQENPPSKTQHEYTLHSAYCTCDT
jgi:hypothetical protein